MEFTKFTSTSTPAFNRVVTLQAWAGEIKAANKVDSLKVTNILGTADKKYVIATLANGNSATMPCSKKATLGAPVTDYMMGENSEGEWVVVTSGGAQSIEL